MNKRIVWPMSHAGPTLTCVELACCLFSHVRERNGKEKLHDICVPISIELFSINLNI
jgi:hypothetical protein